MENVALSTERMSWLKSTKGNITSQDMIKNYIDCDPKRISEALENHRIQQEVINEQSKEIQSQFRENEEVLKRCVGKKLDMERLGQVTDDKLNRLFKEQEITTQRLTGN